ncbi:MAG: peptidylprolyl isomerase [Thermodesulfobacteriota bacterium]
MRILAKKWLWVLTAVVILLAVLLAFPLLKGPPENRVAVVDGAIITKAELDREVSHVKQSMMSTGKPLADSQLSRLKNQVLEQLINRELLYQESQRKGVTVSEAKINEKLEVMKKNFSNQADFENILKEANLSEVQLKAQIEQSLAIDELITKMFVEKVTLSEDEVKTYYESNPESFKQPEQVRASHILIKVAPQEDSSKRASARIEIEKIQQKIRRGENFAALAEEASECPSASKGGDLGYFSRGQMAKPFEDAAFALAPGEISDIVETDFGYHLIKVEDKRAQTDMAFDEIKDGLKSYLTQQKVQEEVVRYVQKLKEQAKVERYLPEAS